MSQPTVPMPPVPAPPAGGAPSATAVPGPPLDPHQRALEEITQVVDDLERSRAADLDDQLVAAERVHEVLSGHLGIGGTGR